MSVQKCLFFQDLEGLTKVLGGMSALSAGMSGRKPPLWAEFSFYACNDFEKDGKLKSAQIFRYNCCAIFARICSCQDMMSS